MSKQAQRIDAAIAALRAGNIDEAVRLVRGGKPVQRWGTPSGGKKSMQSERRASGRRAA
jgi:hypothetical protein